MSWSMSLFVLLVGEDCCWASSSEGYQEFVVDGLGIIADGSDELLGADFSGAVERRADRIFCSVLNLCSIYDSSVTVREALRFLWVGMIKIGAQV